MRGAGAVHGTEKRFSLCGRICEPSPSVKRPPVLAARSQPILAATIGERGKEIATPVCSSIFLRRDARNGEREERIVPVLLRADAGIAVGLDRLGGGTDLAQVFLGEGGENAHLSDCLD